VFFNDKSKEANSFPVLWAARFLCSTYYGFLLAGYCHGDSRIQKNNSILLKYFSKIASVLLPFGEQWRAMRADIEVLKRENEDSKMELKDLKIERLKLYTGNLLIALGKMAFPKLASDSSTHRLQQRLQAKSVEMDLAAAG
jgi:hypothetical protein